MRLVACALVVLLVAVRSEGGVLGKMDIAEAESRCCMPEKWEGDISETQGTVEGGKAQAANSRGSIHVDATNKRLMMNTTTTTLSDNVQVEIYMNATVTFVVYPQVKHCVVLHAPYNIYNCVPKEAVFIGLRNYGKSKAKSGLTASAWTLHVKGKTHDLQAELTVSQDGCYPITQYNMGTASGAPVLKFDEFFNLHEGIKNPSVFDPPSYCASAVHDKEQSRVSEDLRKSYAFL